MSGTFGDLTALQELEVNAMIQGATIQDLLEGSAAGGRSAAKPRPASHEVRVSVAIEAEWRRILNALTVPEYIDVWLTIPGADRLECCPEQEPSGAFRIDVFVAGSRRRVIYGSCLRSRPDEISYLWERTGSGRTARSIVKMRLRSGPRRCSLHLQHRGLRDEGERDQYASIWQRSLGRLREVMERISTGIHP